MRILSPQTRGDDLCNQLAYSIDSTPKPVKVQGMFPYYTKKMHPFLSLYCFISLYDLYLDSGHRIDLLWTSLNFLELLERLYRLLLLLFISNIIK